MNWFDSLRFDSLDGDVTMFTSTDEGTETVAVFDQDQGSVVVHLVQGIQRLREELLMLRERLIRAYDWVENAVNGNDSAMMDYTEYVCGGEEE
jgi:hypothetical protein